MCVFVGGLEGEQQDTVHLDRLPPRELEGEERKRERAKTLCSVGLASVANWMKPLGREREREKA